jgi:hypothetical protein
MSDAPPPRRMPHGAPSRVRLRQLRVIWLPLLLVTLNAILVAVATVATILLLPVALTLLLLAAAGRALIATLSGGRLLARKRRPEDAAEVEPAGRTTLPEATRRELAWRFRPCLVLFPEDPALGPPYRTGELAHAAGADYHPRAVELFLEHVRLRKGRTQWLPDLPDLTDPALIRASLGTPGERESSLEVPWLHGGNPLNIFRHLFPFGRQFSTHWAVPLPKADCGCSRAIWDRYLRVVAADEARPPGERRYPHTLYARVLEGRELPEIGEGHPLSGAVAIQYWWFLFYNDAWNRHQGDWEGITLFLRADAGGNPARYSPLGAAYACHDLGRWRRWQDVERVDEARRPDPHGGHPLVYVARGSHAAYFDYNENGYHPSMSRTLRLPFFGDYKIPSQFVLETRSATDWVANGHGGFSNGELVLAGRVELMPPEATTRDLPALRADDRWWWLAYRGLWGSPEFLPFFGGSGPRGPKWQGVKWANPFRWVMRDCIADDMPYWLEMFAAWEPEDDPIAALLEEDERQPQSAQGAQSTGGRAGKND